MSHYALTSDDYYRNFKQSIKSQDTFLSYDLKLKVFMKFKGISEGPDQYSKLIEGKQRSDIEKDISAFIYSLRERHYTQNSQKAYLNALIHFYVMNDVILNRKKIAKSMSNDDNVTEDDNDNGEKPYTREEIARLLEYSDIRNKVIILLMCSSGMRVGALPILKFGDLTLYQSTKYTKYEYMPTPRVIDTILSVLLNVEKL